MKDKICLLTGGSQGIGKATALELAKQGATVVIVGRNRQRGETAVSEIKSATGNNAISFQAADLAKQAEIRHLAAAFQANHERLDVLINNAGIAARERTLTEDGVETTFAVNHLAPFLLTNLLLPMLKASAPARVVNVASQAHSQSIDFDNLQGEKSFEGIEPYKQSKLANIIFTFELARRLEGSGVVANCLHPGVIRSKLLDDYDYLRTQNDGVKGLLRSVRQLVKKPAGMTAAAGARTTLYLATSPEAATINGKYYHTGKEGRPAEIAYDEAVAQKLWQVSEQLTGLAQNL